MTNSDLERLFEGFIPNEDMPGWFGARDFLERKLNISREEAAALCREIAHEEEQGNRVWRYKPKTVYIAPNATPDDDGLIVFSTYKSFCKGAFVEVHPNWDLDESGFPYTDWISGGWASAECFF